MKFTKEIKAGLIAILAIVGFVMLFQFTKGKSIFSSDNIFYAKYDNVEGLEVSNPLFINGLKVGRVDDIKPITNAEGKISFVVKASVDKGFSFSKKSTLEIYEQGLMSGTAMRINPVYGADLAQSGDTLAANYKLSMMASLGSEVGPMKEQMQSVLKNADSLLTNSNKIMDAQNRAEIRALLISLNKTMASLEAASKQANALLSDNNPRVQQMLDNASLATTSAKDAMDKYGKVAEQIDINQLNGAISKLSEASTNLNILMSGIQSGEGSLGKLAKDEQLYQNLSNTARSLDSLLVDVKANPKRYINISVFGKSAK